jgi:hypothetical protein
VGRAGVEPSLIVDGGAERSEVDRAGKRRLQMRGHPEPMIPVIGNIGMSPECASGHGHHSSASLRSLSLASGDDLEGEAQILIGLHRTASIPPGRPTAGGSPTDGSGHFRLKAFEEALPYASSAASFMPERVDEFLAGASGLLQKLRR